ncbi:Kinesin light chain 3 [Hyphodiscus hymeniophilus]|uniref:Kinesin light chain 3 n=1 Tax=Hyphodiscus hymeniophilus TaxID=353542 RepID=A0A9P6VLT9_9HELO|nr:Kinesin light chain 3 [Hyphodiscus hymeniophilus]
MEPKPTISSDDGIMGSLATKDSLAAALTKQGRYDEAEKLLRGVLATREKLGQSTADPDMLRTMNNLGGVLNGQSRFAEAEGLHRQVLEADEQSLGSEHSDTIISMTNLAAVLRRQGKLEESEEVQRRALESSRKVHGPGNHETVSILTHLGEILVRLHKEEQADQVSREVAELRQTMRNERENVSEAEELHRQKLALCHTSEEKITSMSDLARFLAGRGHHDEAEKMLQEVVKLSTEEYGRNDGKTRAAIGQLVGVLMRNGKYKEAEALHREDLGMDIA